METNRLIQFKVLVETGSLRKAAELLHISSGGLSKSLHTLEEELGVKLMIPLGRGITITEEGQEIYRKLPALLKQIEELCHKQTSDSSLPLVRLGTFEVFSTYFLGHLAATYLATHSFLVREYVPGQLEAAVAAKEVDFGITYLPIPKQGVDFIAVTRIEMKIFGTDSFRKVEPKDYPFVIPVLPVAGSPTGVKGLDGWPSHLFPRKALYQVEMMESALDLCRRGVAVGFFPKFVVGLHNQAVSERYRLKPLLEPSGFEPIVRDVYLVKRSTQREDTVMRLIAKALRRFG